MKEPEKAGRSLLADLGEQTGEPHEGGEVLRIGGESQLRDKIPDVCLFEKTYAASDYEGHALA